MRCLSCGKQIPDSKRMCDECAAKMVSKLIEGKRKDDKKEVEFRFPKDAPRGVVKSWKPKGHAE